MKSKIVIALMALLALTACNSKKRELANKTITIGVMSSMDYLPIAVAKANHYFEDGGITINIQKFYSANERDAALQSGNLDACILDYTGAAIQNAGGVKISLTSQCDGTFELISGKNVEYNTNTDLRGKNFAVSRNTVIDFCTDMILNNAGIKPSEVTKTEINKIPIRLEMLRSEKIDMTVLPDPFATIAKTEGNKLVTSLKDMNYSITGIVFTEKAIYRKEASIRVFYTAYNRAIADLQQKPVATFKDILVSEIGFPEPMAATVVLPAYQPAQLPKGNDLEAVGNWLKSKKLIPADFKIFNIVHTQKFF